MKMNVFSCSFSYTDTKVQQVNINTAINTASKNNKISINNNDNINLVFFATSSSRPDRHNVDYILLNHENYYWSFNKQLWAQYDSKMLSKCQ